MFGHRLLEWLNPEPLNPDPDAADNVVSFLISSWTSQRLRPEVVVIPGLTCRLFKEELTKKNTFRPQRTLRHHTTLVFMMMSPYLQSSVSWPSSGRSLWSQEEWDSGALCPPSRALQQPGRRPHHWCSPLGKQESALSVCLRLFRKYNENKRKLLFFFWKFQFWNLTAAFSWEIMKEIRERIQTLI